MRFILTNNANIKCIERNVNEEDVYFVLNNFHTTLPGHQNGIGLFARVPQGDTVILWLAGSLPLVEPVIIKTVVRRGE